MMDEFEVPSFSLRASLRVLWTATEWLSNLFLILNIDSISGNQYSPQLIRDAQLMPVLYILIFILKSIYWFYSFYRVIYTSGFLSVKQRVLALWFLSIPSGILAMFILKLSAIQSNPFYFIIILFHIGIICKQCFVLGSFPFNIFFQYILSLLFATDFILVLPEQNLLQHAGTASTIDIIIFIIFIMCSLFLLLITFRPISILCEGKYPKFVAPIYRDYYDSEDGGWRNDQIEPVEETAISAYKTQLFSVPTQQQKQGIDHHEYNSDEEEDDGNDGSDLAHSLINMVSGDIILPTSEPSQFDKCFYWNLSLLFIFFIHIPIIILMSLKYFNSFMRLIPNHMTEYSHWQKIDLKIGIVIYIFFVAPTLYILGIVLLILILKPFHIANNCTHTLFWCLFSKQYFDIIKLHRRHNNKNVKEQYYSSLWSFKKRRKKSSIVETHLLHGIVETNQNNIPKAPPNVDNAISSLKDSLIYNQNQNYNKNRKKNRNESINSDQELQKWSEENNNNNNESVLPLSLPESISYKIKTSTNSSIDKTIDHNQ